MSISLQSAVTQKSCDLSKIILLPPYSGGNSDKKKKNPPATAGDLKDVGSIPGSRRSPGGGHGNPLLYSFLENPHGQRSLAGYSPQDCKESDMTEGTQHSAHPISMEQNQS